MSKISNGSRLTIRSEAEKFLAEHGFTAPPLPPEEALAARKLEVCQLTLDDLLVRANLPSDEQKKIQAVLDVDYRVIAFRDRLPIQKRNWGSLHEIGHEYLPWHRELFYRCPLLWLPPSIQEQFEAEADIFAAETFFFGSQFNKLLSEGKFGLAMAKELAENVYGTSYHATFMRLAEESERPCCLLVWGPVDDDNSANSEEGNLQLLYYVPSKHFHMYFPTKQKADDEVVIQVFNDPSSEIVSHEMQIDSRTGEQHIAKAESFCNSYNVFTLMSQPEPKPKKIVKSG